jgi:hypothetical protein
MRTHAARSRSPETGTFHRSPSVQAILRAPRIHASRQPAENSEGGAQTEAAVRAAAGRGGEPLPAASRSFFEARFGYDFGHVRVHVDGAADEGARAVRARAYTLGGDIVFGAGEYAPETHQGKSLLAHELTHVVQQAGAAPVVQREEKIKTEEVRFLVPSTQISAAEVALLAEKKLSIKGKYDLVTSSGSSDKSFTELVEKIALLVVSTFKEPNFRTVFALDFSAVDWKKAGIKDAATKKTFGSGLHAFEVIRWDGGKKLQLRMTYLREITEATPKESAAKIKTGKSKFATGSFSFKTPTAAEKKQGYKDWTESEKDLVHMAVSRVPDTILSHKHVKGIDFYRLPTAGKYSARYDQTKHRMEVADSTFQVTEAGVTTTMSSPADVYKQSSGIAGDAAAGFTSLTEFTIIHEISHALDWGPIRPQVADLVAAYERYKAAKTKADQTSAEKDLAKAVAAFSGKTTLSGSTFKESGGTVAEENPAAETDFEKAVAGKTASTPYAATDAGEAFAEGLALYIVNPGLLKTYRPDLHAYFAKLLSP